MDCVDDSRSENRSFETNENTANAPDADKPKIKGSLEAGVEIQI